MRLTNYFFSVFFTCLIVGLSLPLSSQSLRDSLIFYYPNGDGVDSSGNGLNATLHGPHAVTDRHGEVNGALFFDGHNDYIALPLSPLLKPQFPLTVSFWINPESIDFVFNPFFANDQETGDYHGVWIQLNLGDTGAIAASYGGGLGLTGVGNRRSKQSTSKVSSGLWQHVVVVYNAINDIDLYLNGVDAGGYYEGGLQGPMVYSSDTGAVGRQNVSINNPPLFYWGSMDEIAMWNRALSEQDVAELYQTPIGIENTKIKSFESEFLIFPNPASGYITLKFPLSNNLKQDILVYDITGKLVKREVSNNPSQFTLTINDLEAGLYLVRSVSKNGRGSQKTVVVR